MTVTDVLLLAAAALGLASGVGLIATSRTTRRRREVRRFRRQLDDA